MRRTVKTHVRKKRGYLNICRTVSSGGESSGGEDGGKGTGVALQASLLTLASLLIGRFL